MADCKGVDMAEPTEKRWFGGDDGPAPLALASSNAVESRAHVAYRAYLDHAQTCEDCPQAAFQCETAASLWSEYRELQGEA
jgi:hypothetical protein